MSDSVNRPSHYNAGGVETIEGIRAALGDGFWDYCLGNVLKYVWRCKHKGKLLEDLRKAAKYLEWAIEAAESNCLEMPDSSSGKAIPIPHGWRELEPDEIPLATDMHEWMGGWFFRKDDATNEYKWHSSRHIRKIEPANPSETPNSSIPESSSPWVSERQKPERGEAFPNEIQGVWVEPKPTEWIPKVGDRVRVNCPGRIAHNKAGLIIDVPNSKYAVRIEHEKLTTFNLKAEHLELIEAAS